MTSMPVKLTERRAELLRESDGHHASMLALTREIRVTDARLSEIDFAIAAYSVPLPRAGEPEVPNAEVGAQASASGVSSVAPGAESAPAGEYEAEYKNAISQYAGTDAYDAYIAEAEMRPQKKPRAPKRDIRGMVMEYVERRPQPPTLVELAAGVDMPVSRIEKVVASLQRDERVILIGGVVKRTKEAEPQAVSPGHASLHEEAYRVGGSDGLAGHRDHAARYASGQSYGDYESGYAEGQRERHATAQVEIVGQGPVEVEPEAEAQQSEAAE